jgi:hypothetical protein
MPWVWNEVMPLTAAQHVDGVFANSSEILRAGVGNVGSGRTGYCPRSALVCAPVEQKVENRGVGELPGALHGRNIEALQHLVMIQLP